MSRPDEPVSQAGEGRACDQPRDASIVNESDLAAGEGRASWHSPLAWWTLILVFALGLAADLVTKRLAFEHVAGFPMELASAQEVASPSYRLPFHQGMRAIPFDLLDFHLVLNHGAVFGVGQHRRGIFVSFTIAAVVAAVWVFGWWTRESNRLAHVGIGLILAGGVGNLHDRLFVGAVRDFLHMIPRWDLPMGLNWPGGSNEVFPWVFNMADMMLLAGMTILLIHSWREDSRKAKRTAAAALASAVAPAQGQAGSRSAAVTHDRESSDRAADKS